MAKIVVYSLGEFRRALERLANPLTHVVITDESTSVISSVDERDVAEAVEFARGRGFEVILGHVQEVQG